MNQRYDNASPDKLVAQLNFHCLSYYEPNALIYEMQDYARIYEMQYEVVKRIYEMQYKVVKRIYEMQYEVVKRTYEMQYEVVKRALDFLFPWDIRNFINH